MRIPSLVPILAIVAPLLLACGGGGGPRPGGAPAPVLERARASTAASGTQVSAGTSAGDSGVDSTAARRPGDNGAPGQAAAHILLRGAMPASEDAGRQRSARPAIATQGWSRAFWGAEELLKGAEIRRPVSRVELGLRTVAYQEAAALGLELDGGTLAALDAIVAGGGARLAEDQAGPEAVREAEGALRGFVRRLAVEPTAAASAEAAFDAALRGFCPFYPFC